MQITSGTVRFVRSMQPAQYEKAEAEVSLCFVVDDGEDAAEISAEALRLAKRQALAAVGKLPEADQLPEEKPKRGRPKKTAAKKSAEPSTSTTIAVEPDAKAEKAATKKATAMTEEPAEEDFMSAPDEGGEDISDDDLQAAAQAAAKRVTGRVVKAHMSEAYGLQQLGKLAKDKRAEFIASLDKLEKPD